MFNFFKCGHKVGVKVPSRVRNYSKSISENEMKQDNIHEISCSQKAFRVVGFLLTGQSLFSCEYTDVEESSKKPWFARPWKKNDTLEFLTNFLVTLTA